MSKLFSYISKGILVCILVAGCAERPAGMVDVDNVPPTVTIVSPSIIDTSQISSKSSEVNLDEKITVSGSAVEGRNPAAGKSEGISGIKRDTAEKTAATRKVENMTGSKNSSDGIYKKGAEVVFEGEAVDVDEDSLSEASLRWTSDIEGEIGRGYSFIKSDLSAGEHQIVLTATDSEGGVGRDTISIFIEELSVISGNQIPTVKILSLEEGWNLLNTAELILRGIVDDPEEGELEGESLVWKSSIDGVLGIGSPLDVTGKLALGDHTITLMGTDSEGATGKFNVNISIADKIDETVNNSPVANIPDVEDILILLETEVLSLEASASDSDGEIVSMGWSSDIDGELGTGATLEIPAADLTLGDHMITFVATDDDGDTGSDSVELTIKKNQLPVADILSLAGGEILLETDDLILEGSGSDEEDGTLDGESLVWSSDIDGGLGTGGTLDVTGQLSIGDHTITLTAIDSEGATGSEKVSITVDLAPPTNLTAEAINSTTVQLSWQDNSNNETNYVIEQNSEVILKPDKNVTSFEVTDLLESTSYKFRVAVENSKGISAYSEPITIETLPAKITRSVTADNTLDSGMPDSIFSDGILQVGALLELENEYRAALAFADLQSDISGRTITNAILQLYPHSALNAEVNLAVNAFAEKWNTNEITWNNKPPVLRLETGPIEEQAILNLGKPFIFNITEIVRNWADGNWEVNGLQIIQSTSGLLDVAAEFESLDTGESEGLEPVIIVEFGD